MKLSRVALLFVAAAGCVVGVCALQRTADFGFGDDDTPSNVKSEFYWSRLAYGARMASLGGYSHHGWFNSWSRDYPKADRQCTA